MEEIDFSSLFKPMTEEELRVAMIEKYNKDLETPENFSKWFPNITKAMLDVQSPLKYPESKFYTLPFEWVQWLQSDSYSGDKIGEFNNYIKTIFGSFLKDGKTYFIKTGNFSDKFNFVNPKLENIDNIGSQFLNVFYTSMMFDADTSNEIVVREYIEPEKGVKTIYNGMPLHTEYRVFVNINGDDSYIHDVVNYWHPDVMRGIYNQEDLHTYLDVESELIEKFDKNKDFVGEEILKISKNIEGITGSWSIDVMQNGDDFYVIDSARMETSALTEFIYVGVDK